MFRAWSSEQLLSSAHLNGTATPPLLGPTSTAPPGTTHVPAHSGFLSSPQPCLSHLTFTDRSWLDAAKLLRAGSPLSSSEHVVTADQTNEGREPDTPQPSPLCSEEKAGGPPNLRQAGTGKPHCRAEATAQDSAKRQTPRSRAKLLPPQKPWDTWSDSDPSSD